MLTLNPSDLAMQLKILILNQHLQTLGIALAQVKTGNTFKNILKSDILFLPCVEQKKLLLKI